MPTQLQELAGTPIEMLRQMRQQPGAYSRALIAQTIAEKEAQEAATKKADDTRRQYSLVAEQREKARAATENQAPSGFRQDYQRGLQSVAPVYRDVERWLGKKFGTEARDAMGRRDALNKLRLSLPNDGVFEYFNRQNPERQIAPAIRSFIDKNSAALINNPEQFDAFVADPAGYVQMQNRVLTPREKGDRLAPTIEANGEAMPAAMAEAPPESIPAPYLPPLQAGGGNAGEFNAMAQAAPPWLRPREAASTGAVGEGGTTAGGRPVIATAPVPAQNPALAAAVPPTTPAAQAIAAGEEAAAETVAPERAAVAGMSPELQKATQDYMKLIGDTGGESDERDRYMSLARAGFAMAGSNSPYLLQAIGQGGTAGLDSYQQARARAAERRLQQARGTLEVAKVGEDSRRAGVREGLDRDRYALDKDKAEKEAADRQTARDLQLEELGIRKEGQRLQSEYYNRPDYNILGTTENGDAIIFDQRSGKTQTVAGVKPTGRTGAADVEKALEVRQRIVNEMYPNLSREERADIVFGRSIPSATELRVKAREMASKEIGTAADYRFTGGKDKEPYDVVIQRKTDEIMDFLRGGRGGIPVPAPAPAPAAVQPGAVIRYDAQGNRIP